LIFNEKKHKPATAPHAYQRTLFQVAMVFALKSSLPMLKSSRVRSGERSVRGADFVRDYLN
jgi:hypothetical protein